MSKRTGILAAVAALVVAVAAFVVIVKPFTPTVVNLPQMTQQDVQNGDKPLVIVITGANCAGCPDILKAFGAQVAKHPEVKFVQVDASVAGAPPQSLPAVVVMVPGSPQPSPRPDPRAHRPRPPSRNLCLPNIPEFSLSISDISTSDSL